MRPRGFVITVAAVLAILATGAVYLYVRNVQNNNGGGTTVSVVVAKQDIAVGAKLDDVISQGGVTFRRFPKADVVRGAVTNISEIKGTVTNAPIVAGEQISTARLVGSVTQPTGGALGIPGLYVTGDPGGVDDNAKIGMLGIRIGLGWSKSHQFTTGQCPVMKYNRALMQCILHDKIKIAKAVNVTTISLDGAPKGYKDFDKGAARKFVIDPHGMIAA